MSQFKTVVSILILVLISVACSAKEKITPPEVELTDMRFEGVSLFETKAVFQVRIDNENPFPVDVRGAVHRIYLNGEYVGKGFDNESFRLEELRSVTRSVPVSLSNLSLVERTRGLINRSDIEYRIESTLYTSGKGGRDTIKVNNKGSFDYSGFSG